ncbi:MAG: response regulator [Deltaproteobacteria bacterium]|jgi:signal transduction histidine kinase|nr:response regulator [Deltaproteobacteria bacterium]
MKILIVDDNLSNRNLLANIIEKYETGYEIDFAEDGEEGLNTALKTNYDIIFLDHEMPKMNGIQVIEALKEKGNETPIIMVTIHESVKLTVSAIKLGVLDFINKPFNLGEIAKAIEKVKLKQENEKLQMRLILQDRLAALGSAMDSLSHEIMTPLTNIFLYLKKLRIATKGPKELFDLITEDLNKIDQSISNYKNFNKKTDDNEIIDIRTVVDSTIDVLVNTHKKFQFKTGYKSDGALLVKGNRNEIQQVVVNILNNAVDASEHLPEKIIKIDAALKDNLVTIKISDFGEGITEHQLPNIFNFFYTTKKVGKGTGLGLPICKNLLQKHNGQLVVDSKPGQTTFTISLPVHSVD